MPIMTANALRALLAETDALLLDFDGPVCRVYATMPDYLPADRLRSLLQAEGHALPDAVAATSDPSEVLAFADSFEDPALAARVDDTLIEAELEAVERALPTSERPRSSRPPPDRVCCWGS